MAEYPNREKFFSHKLMRVMIRTCAAQEIGATGFMLVSIIASTEHAKWYSAPVTYWNGQLMQLMALNSWGKLDRARKKCIDAGWLHYEAGGKHTVGKYWTTIPPQFGDIPDGACDCDAHVLFSTDGDPSVIDNGQSSPVEIENEGQSSPVEMETGLKRDKAEIETGLKRDKTVNILKEPNPSPKPKPIPRPKSAREDQGPRDGDDGEEDTRPRGEPPSLPVQQEIGQQLVMAWNNHCLLHAELKPTTASWLSQGRRQVLVAAFNEYPQFESLWHRALAKVPIGRDINGWQPDFDWMLDVTNLLKVIEGQYDERVTRTRATRQGMDELLQGFLHGNSN